MLFKPVLPVLEYVVFYDYIKNELCVNKDKVEMKCNGKCHLMKEMAKASDSSEKGNDKKHFSVETTFVFYQEITENFRFKPNYFIQKSKIPTNNNVSYSYLDAVSVFRPPIV